MNVRHSVRQGAGRSGWFAGALLATLLSAGHASADVIPPEEMACQSREVGATCSARDSAGTCQIARCSRLDYASWDRDASISPPSVEYDCRKCVVDPDAGTAPGSGGGCSVGAAGAASPWALAILGALGLARRRRARA